MSWIGGLATRQKGWKIQYLLRKCLSDPVQSLFFNHVSINVTQGTQRSETSQGSGSSLYHFQTQGLIV